MSLFVTRVFPLEADRSFALAAARDALLRGGVVVFPTETFYGIGVNPRDSRAVDRLVRLKNRLPHKPIPLIATDRVACAEVALLPEALEPLCAAFWPGPLTLVLEPLDPSAWPLAIAGAHKTLGVRVSSHSSARALAAACGGLVTSTSANFASEAAVVDCAALDPDLMAEVDVVLDGGVLPGGLPSTVLRVSDGRFAVLREGAVSRAQLARLGAL